MKCTLESIGQQESFIMKEYLTEALNIIGEKINTSGIINTIDNDKNKTFDKNIY